MAGKQNKRQHPTLTLPSNFLPMKHTQEPPSHPEPRAKSAWLHAIPIGMPKFGLLVIR